MAEQQAPPAAKFEDENGYAYATSGRCRTTIHTCTNYLLATVLLAWSFRKEGAFKAWLISTTKHFMGLEMWKRRYFSQKEHGTQWATRMLSAAFASLTVVQAVTVGVLNREFAAYSAGAIRRIAVANADETGRFAGTPRQLALHVGQRGSRRRASPAQRRQNEWPHGPVYGS